MSAGTRIADLSFAAIDFESAGASRGQTDTPVQIGIARMDSLMLVPGGEGSWVSYLHSPRPVTWAAAQVHGIRTEDLAGAPTLTSLWPEINGRLRDRVVVAHGAGTEKRFLRAFPLHGFGPWVDTLTLSRRLWPGLPDYSLETLVKAAGLSGELERMMPGGRFHDALYDSVGTLLVLRWLIQSAGIGERSGDGLLW